MYNKNTVHIVYQLLVFFKSSSVWRWTYMTLNGILVLKTEQKYAYMCLYKLTVFFQKYLKMLCLYLLGQNCLYLTFQPYLSSETFSRKYETLPNIVFYACKNYRYEKCRNATKPGFQRFNQVLM